MDKYIGLSLLALSLGFFYIAWLDMGCPTNGVMTWGGKVCVEAGEAPLESGVRKIDGETITLSHVSYDAPTISTEMLYLVNSERKTPLTLHAALEGRAQARAEEVCASSLMGEEAHQGFEKYMVEFSLLGENLAWDYHTPEEAHTALVASPGHYENIVNERYDYLGVGYVKTDTCNLIVQLFASEDY